MSRRTAVSRQLSIGAVSVLMAGSCRILIRRRIAAGRRVPSFAMDFGPGLVGLIATAGAGILWDWSTASDRRTGVSLGLNAPSTFESAIP